MQEIPSFLERSWTTPIFIENDDVWFCSAAQKVVTAQKFGRLSAMLMAEKLKNSQNSPQNKTFGYAKCFHDFEFVIRFLIPYLHCLGDENKIVPPSPQLLTALDYIGRHLSDLEKRLGEKQAIPIQQQLKDNLFPQRCLAIAGMLVPLHPLPRGVVQYDVTVNGRPYQYCSYGTRPISRLADKQNTSFMQQTNPLQDNLTSVSNLIIEMENLITKFLKPINNQRYKTIFKDDIHELQYNRGNFILVRGPLTVWSPPEPPNHRSATSSRLIHARRVSSNKPPKEFYLALQIKGKTRFERLAAPVGMLNRQELFWSASGMPNVKGVCLGDGKQYRKFLSADFNEAEAVVQYLNAAVLAKTGISLCHQWCKSRRKPQMSVGSGRR